jgi:hypothetical protein
MASARSLRKRPERIWVVVWGWVGRGVYSGFLYAFMCLLLFDAFLHTPFHLRMPSQRF